MTAVGATAQLHVLQVGSGRPAVRSSVTLVVDGDSVIVIDPGMAPSQAAILDPLAAAGFAAAEVTDVVISHHHPDHTVNVGLFGDARVHDHWAIYQHDTWTSRRAEGFLVSPSVVLWETPGHTPQDTPPSSGLLTESWPPPTCGGTKPVRPPIRSRATRPRSSAAAGASSRWRRASFLAMGRPSLHGAGVADRLKR